MAEKCHKGDRVEIYILLLDPASRPAELPPETRKVPLECRISGWALSSKEIGEEIEISTSANRRVKGTLTRINPGYDHTFGPAVPELSAIGTELRNLLKEEER
ncbi:MAG: 2-amino-4-ketopentanoate thiolase [Firmicutes bacterium]|nr:2-amino-4-ketopentanoate thiolase [Bacillota bacterium]